MPDLTRHDITAAREARYWRRMNLRVTSQEHAKEFVDDVGFCFLFPIQGVDAAYNVQRWMSNRQRRLPRHFVPQVNQHLSCLSFPFGDEKSISARSSSGGRHRFPHSDAERTYRAVMGHWTNYVDWRQHRNPARAELPTPENVIKDTFSRCSA